MTFTNARCQKAEGQNLNRLLQLTRQNSHTLKYLIFFGGGVVELRHWVTGAGHFDAVYWPQIQESTHQSETTASFITSVRPHGTAQLPLDGFSWKSMFEWRVFMKICLNDGVSWNICLNDEFSWKFMFEWWVFMKIYVLNDGFSWKFMFECFSKICRGKFLFH